MGRWTNDAAMDALLDKIAEADKEAACTAQPTTYYEAVDPPARADSTAYSLGDAVRPIARNGFCYECTRAGTSGGSPPTFPTTPGNTVDDPDGGGAEWTCRANYNVAQASMSGGDFTKANGDVSGRKHTVAAKAGASIHTSGTADHGALVDDANKILLDVTTTTPQALVGGGTVDLGAWDHEVTDPPA